MKQTLVLCLWCGLAASSVAQTPTVVEKATSPIKAASTQKPAVTSAASGSSQPSNVKVVPVPVAHSKPAAGIAKPAAKPAVVAVQPSAKPAVAAVPAKPASALAKQAAVAAPAKTAIPAPVVAVKPASAPKTAAAAKAIAPPTGSDPFSKKKSEAQAKSAPALVKAPENKKSAVVAVNENKTTDAKKSEPKKVSAVTHRDPFVSPVVHMGAVGSGCSTGKRCLAIDQIALRGVVKSENGMIAVVVNTMDKAYFLRENDPVFNGYVTKITPDSIVFKETFRDRLGKEMTRDVTKTIIRPVA